MYGQLRLLIYFYMTSVPINLTNRYIFYLLNTDDINYANKTLILSMYVCMYGVKSIIYVCRHLRSCMFI